MEFPSLKNYGDFALPCDLCGTTHMSPQKRKHRNLKAKFKAWSKIMLKQSKRSLG